MWSSCRRSGCTRGQRRGWRCCSRQSIAQRTGQCWGRKSGRSKRRSWGMSEPFRHILEISGRNRWQEKKERRRRRRGRRGRRRYCVWMAYGRSRSRMTCTCPGCRASWQYPSRHTCRSIDRKRSLCKRQIRSTGTGRRRRSRFLRVSWCQGSEKTYHQSCSSRCTPCRRSGAGRCTWSARGTVRSCRRCGRTGDLRQSDRHSSRLRRRERVCSLGCQTSSLGRQ